MGVGRGALLALRRKSRSGKSTRARAPSTMIPFKLDSFLVFPSSKVEKGISRRERDPARPNILAIECTLAPYLFFSLRNVSIPSTCRSSPRVRGVSARPSLITIIRIRRGRGKVQVPAEKINLQTPVQLLTVNERKFALEKFVAVIRNEKEKDPFSVKENTLLREKMYRWVSL